VRGLHVDRTCPDWVLATSGVRVSSLHVVPTDATDQSAVVVDVAPG